MALTDAVADGKANQTGLDEAIAKVVQNQMAEQINNYGVCTPEDPRGEGSAATNGLPGLILSDGSAGAAAGAAAACDGTPKPSGNGEGVCTVDDPYGDGRKPPEDPAEFLRRLRGQPKKN
jgi:hypothetical protein